MTANQITIPSSNIKPNMIANRIVYLARRIAGINKKKTGEIKHNLRGPLDKAAITID